MIVCQCQSISDHDIRAAVSWMRAADPQTIITAGKIYRALGKRADCGGCMPLFLDTMRSCSGLAVDGCLGRNDDGGTAGDNRPPVPRLRRVEGGSE